ncbi:MAG: aspartate carbamoyltransferase regulatory subunit [Oscillospiraceae bacterium]|nr:aspartate carbamoyltransferase regulatory subunit [Oscillospiraceae bacterium]MCD8100020.1 aspartate carbamoyltransferase regulatory subunit [Oscillospiraceae bacterium]MCD8192827.1 aspartate carbamoyltransferase regulatory subunit [Oscillospiraceae bacterium]
MNIDSIRNGYVIDHITAGRGMEIYNLLKLNRLDCQVAIINNAVSGKLGRKDIIKVDGEFELDMAVLGYVDPGVTIDVIRNGVLVEKKKAALPEKLTNVLFCRNPRCITTVEQEIPHIFRLANAEKRIYRCIYCDAEA